MYMKFFQVAFILACMLGLQEATGQQAPDTPLKEVQLGNGAFTAAKPIPSWVDLAPIPTSDKPQPIVVGLAETHLLVGRVPVTFVRRATLINDTASLASAGRISISFAPDYERVELHSIRIHRDREQFDRTTTSNIRFLQREQGLENDVYTGRVTASILVEDLRVGDTLEIAYSTYGQNPVFDGKYFQATGWDQALPTLRRRVVLNYPSARPVLWRMVGDRNAVPIVPADTIHGDIHRIEFNQENLAQTVNEPQTSPDFIGLRFLQFSEFSNWSEVAAWAGTLFKTSAAHGDEFRNAVSNIRALGTDEARVAAALEFVQSQIRYFSVSLGESSHRPAAPDEVLRRRYGDCKDKSLLLIALLRELGIDGKPVLLEIGRHAGLEKTLPSPQLFNHAIVLVTLDGKHFFLDPTRLGQHGRLDRMGQSHEGTEVLVVAPETRELSTIPIHAVDVVNDEITEHATLPKLGADGQLEVKRVFNGVRAEAFRILLERTSHERIVKIIGDAMERRYPGAQLIGEPTIQDDTSQNVFSISASYKIPKLATERDGNWFVTFKPDNLTDALATSPSANRATPLRIPAFPFHGTYSFEMTFPENVSVSTDPRAQAFSNEYFSASVTDYFRGNIAKKTIDLTTHRFAVDAENYPHYAEDLRSTNKAIVGVIFVAKFSIRPDDASKQLDFSHRLMDLRNEMIQKTTETIKGGKLSGVDLANTYCLRATAYADLERFDEAFEDANASVRLAPNSPAMLNCRAEIYFSKGQFEKSIADYSKAISLGSTDAQAFRGRGVSRFFVGQMEDASADLEKASQLADSETKIYCDIWLAAAYSRLGKPLPESLVKRAATEAHGEWPRAGLAMITGAVSPEDSLKTLDTKKGDDLQMALSEAYFYIGERYMAVGDKQAAQGYFEKARDLGVIIYTEHIAAGFELNRLKPGDASLSAKAPAAESRAAP
jgi:lipoprotein NlpI